MQEHQSSQSRGQLLELATGEGKTLVIATFASIKALVNGGRKVDIACSSSILAEADAVECQEFYKYLGLTSSHLPSNEDRMAKRAAYQADIVYGTVADFSADILKKKFDEVDMRNGRDVDECCLIVDEVDNLTIDEVSIVFNQ